eukprot:CFRG2551T1
MLSACHRMYQVALVLLIALGQLSLTYAFYVPGLAPQDFAIGDVVPLKAVKMTSVKTQLPYEYYSLPFCDPENTKVASENLGEKLRGDRIQTTPYKIEVMKNQTCSVLCSKTYTKQQSAQFSKRIDQSYFVHWMMDNLPSGTRVVRSNGKPMLFDGYPLGMLGSAVKGLPPKNTYINNHVDIKISYHETEPEGSIRQFRIVSFEVIPLSISEEILTPREDNTCSLSTDELKYKAIYKDKGTTVFWTYSVEWMKSDIPWASRWDLYLSMSDTKVHWLSMLNSLLIVLFLSGIVAVIIIRTLRRDIARYNNLDDDDASIEEYGWKLVHGDVFRSPRYHMLLCAIVGTGVQGLGMSSIVLTMAMLGFLSPSSRGSFAQMSLATFVVMGLFAGYFSGRLYKTLKGKNWKKAALMTAGLFPTILLATVLALNMLIWGQKSSGAVPVTAMITIVIIWASVFPLVFLGYFFGYRKQPYDHPVRTNQIPRQVPEQNWYMNTLVAMLMAGTLPFGATFIEFYFIFSAIWQNQIYYLFGFLFLVFFILIICCSEVTICMIYFQLCAEDYNWWWRAICVSGSSAIYMGLYSVYYFITRLDISEPVPTILYFGYSALMAMFFFILSATIGFYACYQFLTKIYAQVRVD